MWKFIKSPLVRISFGLVMLTVAMLLITDLLGLVPDTRNAELQSRKVITESLAVQLSTEIADKRLHSIEEILRSVVERNKTVLSAAVRTDSDSLMAEFGSHERYWTLKPGDKSTATQVQVGLFNAQGRWGSVELRFSEITDGGMLLSFSNSFLSLILFMVLVGFLAYLLFLKRTMRELNPDAVIPERVRTALDTLAEGLLIVDRDGYVVFSNEAFARKMNLLPNELVGKSSSSFNWETDGQRSGDKELPWMSVLQGKALPGRVMIRLKNGLRDSYTFIVNATPITATAGKVRGVLITFNDITEIEVKNEELRRTLGKLERSQREITRQNQELQVLATRDPLTDTLNRRSLFQGLEALFAEAIEEGEKLSCIMVDIDRFKSVNDRFGHAVGDKVIKFLAAVLTEHSRPVDLVGRFGGEEFVVVLPDADMDIACSVAERMREAVQEGRGLESVHALRITSSFGVSTLTAGVRTTSELVDQADKALYFAKENGRNRVVCWSGSLENQCPEVPSGPPSSEILPITDEAPSIEKVLSATSKEQKNLDAATKASGESSSEASQPSTPLSNPEGLQTVPYQPASESTDDAVILAQGRQSSRLLLFDRIDQAIKRSQRYRTQIAVLMIDVDAFRTVNKTLGLAAGEKLAKVLVTRLKQMLRNTDTVTLTRQNELFFSISRLGSNEIVALLTDLDQGDAVTSILQRVFAAYSSPAEIEGHEFYPNTSIGVSLYPSDGEDADTLIKNASSVLHEARKQQGKNKFQFYSDELHQRSRKQIRLDAELHHALERDELVLYYQPKVDLKTGTILSMEALLRWQHPQLGLVPPNDFIPLAEQTGLIEEISQWVIRTVCQQIRFWEESGHGTIVVAVNLSPVEFRNPDLAKHIIALADEYGIATSALEMEITETVVMQNIETAVATLEQLSEAGFSIAVDDFGTGYSSLSYLKRFPLNKVKIDRSFVIDFMEDSEDATIVSTIIAMGHSLGLRVVAEGVETEEQLRFLQDLHCDEIQGYLISRPVPVVEVNDLLARSSSIRRMILDYGINYTGLADQQGAGYASGMIGVLNKFPVKDTGLSYLDD